MSYGILTKYYTFTTAAAVKAGQHAKQHTGITGIYDCEYREQCKLKCNFGEIEEVEDLGKARKPQRIKRRYWGWVITPGGP